jgi:hypothetical protein
MTLTSKSIDRFDVVIVGDVDESLAIYAKTLYPEAQHYSEVQHHTETYVSIGDVPLGKFISILIKSDKIIYHDKNNWQHDATKNKTLEILFLLYQFGFQRKILNFDRYLQSFSNPLYIENFTDYYSDNLLIKSLCNFSSTNHLGLADIRRSLGPQIWVAGCSYAYGIGLDLPEQRYGNIVANTLQLPISYLSVPSASIDLIADQVIRANLQEGDILLCGLTGINRFTWFDDQGKLQKITLKTIREGDFDRSTKNFFQRKILDPSQMYLAQRHILQIIAVCKRLKVKLLLYIHENLSLEEHAKDLKIFLNELDCFFDISQLMASRFASKDLDSNQHLDTGNDNRHPGPNTHKAWADIILQQIHMRSNL